MLVDRKVAELIDNQYGGLEVARAFVLRNVIAPALDPSVRSIIAGARRFTATDAFVAQSRLRAMQGTLSAVWKTFDVLLVPSAPTIYRLAEVAADAPA